MKPIPFNRPYMTDRSLEYIRQAHENGHLSGDGPFSKKCEAWLEHKINCRRALLTHSCTAALEMAAILCDLKPGDEVLLPSFTFVSTANAFVLRGAVPVFVDIRADTLNIDENQVEEAITPRTKAIVAVHYGGIACEMDALRALADKHGLLLIEDAAQGILSTYRGRTVGSLGHLAALSFHETKTLISGEGGALLLNDTRFIDRAEIIREKGTNRSQFFRGQVDKYTWFDIGSSYLPSDMIAAFLWSQLEDARTIIERRRKIWDVYHAAFAEPEKKGQARRPIVPAHCGHNAHLYYLLLADGARRDRFILELKKKGIAATFHYIPLHDSPAGKKYGRTAGRMLHTDDASERLVRLPLWLGLENELGRVIEEVKKGLS